MPHKSQFIPLTGQRFGLLKVVSRAPDYTATRSRPQAVQTQCHAANCTWVLDGADVHLRADVTLAVRADY